tara:strand:+ start:1913 stop:2530 length:618 start_codon:yes stop_codon:yes gene_type:complete
MFQKLLPKNCFFVKTPMYLCDCTIKCPCNNKFFSDFFKWRTKEKVVFLVYSITENFAHCIAGVIDMKSYTIDLYDQTGETDIYKSLDCNKLFPHEYNMIYQYVIHTLKERFSLNKFKIQAHTRNELRPLYCVQNSNGMCAFWSLIYIILRSNDVDAYKAPEIIYDISNQAVIKKENQIKAFVFLIEILEKQNKKDYSKNIMNVLK